MQNGITPKINLTDRIEFSKLDSMQGFSSARLDGIEEAQTTDFNGVLTGLVEQLNQTVNAPEQLTQDAMQSLKLMSILQQKSLVKSSKRMKKLCKFRYSVNY